MLSRPDDFVLSRPDAPVRSSGCLFGESGRQLSRNYSLNSCQGDFDMILSREGAAAAQSGKFNRGATHASVDIAERRESRLLETKAFSDTSGEMHSIEAKQFSPSVSSGVSDYGSGHSLDRSHPAFSQVHGTAEGKQPPSQKRRKKKPAPLKGEKKLTSFLSVFSPKNSAGSQNLRTPKKSSKESETKRKNQSPASPRGAFAKGNTLV